MHGRTVYLDCNAALCILLQNANVDVYKRQQIDRVVQNRPYADVRPLHFGVLLGTHVQDVELNNVGIQHLTHEDGSVSERLITVDQDRWDAGLTVGVLAEMRLSKHFQFRIAPAMYFGNRHLTFRDYAVSYTHLDVYKRQLLSSWLIKIKHLRLNRFISDTVSGYVHPLSSQPT